MKFPERCCRTFWTPCRICGGRTRYYFNANHANYGLVRCDNPECIEKSRLLKNENIRQVHLRMYAAGQRKKLTDAWKGVSRVSAEELLLLDWLTRRGWKHQFHIVTGLGNKKNMPGCFDLDFALPGRKLYVEVDGAVHRLRKERDERRDRILNEMGWKGLRIPARLVYENIKEARSRINEFSLTH